MTENQESGQELGSEKMNSALNALQSFGVSQEVAEVINRSSDDQQQDNNGAEANTAGASQENTETNALSNNDTTTGTPPEPEETEPSQDDDNEISIESEIFGGKKVLVKKTEEATTTQPPVENIEQLNTQIKETLGFESFDELTGKVKTWQEQEKTFEEATLRLSNVEKLFQILPPELHQAVTAVANGQDWKKVLSETPSVDYRKDISDYKPSELVEAFFPGQFSPEDWEEYNDADGDPKIKKMVDLLVGQSKDKFNQTKESIANKATMSVQQAQQAQQAFDQSVASTVGKLSTQVEGISETYIKNVEKELKSPGSIAKLFYNEDGTLSEGGALAYVMARDGFGLIEQYKKAVMRKAETEVNQDLLNRGARVPSGNRGTASTGNEIRPEVLQEIDKVRNLMS